jgi:LPXTG-motif cell wall-anchored protein
MEQANEKDNFWLYIAGVIVVALVLVFAFKSQKAALEPGVNDVSAQAQTKADLDKTFNRLHGNK